MEIMKIKIKITGPKVHDVGYRYILMGMAMANRIRMFEAHNIENSGVEEVQVFADGDEEAVKAFCAQVETKRPVHSDVSNFVFDAFEGDVMKIGEYAQLCATIQLNKAIPLLLDIRDDLKEMKGDVKEMKGDIKAVRKTGDETLNEIKAVRKNTDTIPQISEDMKAVRKTTDATLDEIKGMREDIQPGYATHFRQVQSDVKAIKERLGMQ